MGRKHIEYETRRNMYFNIVDLARNCRTIRPFKYFISKMLLFFSDPDTFNKC